MRLPKGGTFRLELEGNPFNGEKEVLWREEHSSQRESNLSRLGDGSGCAKGDSVNHKANEKPSKRRQVT